MDDVPTRPNSPFGLDGVYPLRIGSISGWPSYPITNVVLVEQQIKDPSKTQPYGL